MDEWPPELTFLQELEELMKCPICFDLMQAPVILPSCEHNYCSLCIRRYFSQREQCPMCGSPASSNQLRGNGVMEKTIDQFKKIRSPLHSLCVNKLLQTTTVPQSGSDAGRQTFSENRSTPRLRKSSRICDNKDTRNGSTTPSNSAKRPASQSGSDSEDSDVQFISEEENCSPGSSSSKVSSSASQMQQSVLSPSLCLKPMESLKPRNVQSRLFVPSSGSETAAKENARAKTDTRTVGLTYASPKAASPLALSHGQNSDSATTGTSSSPQMLSPLKMFCAKSGQSSPQSGVPDVGKVPCPVCGVQVVAKSVNRHLDLCLGRQEKPESVKKRKLLPKLVYNLLSDKDLRKRLKDLGLTAKGDRQVLIKRHHEFTLYHNADCDSIAPREINELVKEFEDAQKVQVKLSAKTPASSQSILRFTKDSKQEDIEKARKEYAAKHKDQFQSLIQQARNRMRSARNPRPASAPSAAGGQENGDSQGHTSESSVAVDISVDERKGCRDGDDDDGDLTDCEIVCSTEVRMVTEAKKRGHDPDHDEGVVNDQGETLESWTASEMVVCKRSSYINDVSHEGVVTSRDACKNTVGLSSEVKEGSAKPLAETAAVDLDIFRDDEDSEEENGSDVFDCDPKPQCTQNGKSVKGRGKRALKSSKPSWLDTTSPEPSLSPDRSPPPSESACHEAKAGMSSSPMHGQKQSDSLGREAMSPATDSSSSETDPDSVQVVRKGSQPDGQDMACMMHDDSRMTQSRSQRKGSKGKKGTRDSGKHSETSVTSSLGLTAMCEAEDPDSQGEMTGSTEGRADSSWCSGRGEKTCENACDSSENGPDPGTTSDWLERNNTDYFKLELSDCEDEPLSSAQKWSEVSPPNKSRIPEGCSNELNSMCNEDEKSDLATAGEVNTCQTKESSSEIVGEMKLGSSVPETDQETGSLPESCQNTKPKSMLKKKVSSDAILKKSVRFTGLRSRISDIQNKGDDDKTLRERLYGGKDRGQIGLSVTTVTRDEAEFLADLRKTGCHDKSSKPGKVDPTENGVHVSLEVERDHASSESSAVDEINECIVQSQLTSCVPNQKTKRAVSKCKKMKTRKSACRSEVSDTGAHHEVRNCGAVDTAAEDHETVLQTCEGVGLLEEKPEIGQTVEMEKAKGKTKKKKKHSILPTVPEESTDLKRLDGVEVAVEGNGSGSHEDPVLEVNEAVVMQDKESKVGSQRREGHTQQIATPPKSDLPDAHTSAPSQSFGNKCWDDIYKQSLKQKGRKSHPEQSAESATSDTAPGHSADSKNLEEASCPKTGRSRPRKRRTNSVIDKHNQQTPQPCAQTKPVETARKRRKTSQSRNSTVLPTIPEADMRQSSDVEWQKHHDAAPQSIPETGSDVEKPARTEHRRRKLGSSRSEGNSPCTALTSPSHSEQPSLMEEEMPEEKVEKSKTRKRKLCEHVV
ncbi:uncharacterized protein LOC143284692 [Babylonia areolata]|uniref:uncharacterized protein LOC143284692 n=1 Tax=Babylonia areolata TaxID=304850 RepID=UPI003FCFF186